MVKGGKMNPRGGYYVHIEPEGSLFAGGIWCPSPAMLKALRRDVYDNVEEFLAIIRNPEDVYKRQHIDTSIVTFF